MWDMHSAVYHDRNKKRSVLQTIAESLEWQGTVSFLPNQELLPAASCQLELLTCSVAVYARVYGSHISALN